jgi:hypothetical protein
MAEEAVRSMEKPGNASRVSRLLELEPHVFDRRADPRQFEVGRATASSLVPSAICTVTSIGVPPLLTTRNTISPSGCASRLHSIRHGLESLAFAGVT